jgi:hypothetical protein
MNRRALRTALATSGLCTLAACIVNLSFDMPQTFTVLTASGVTSLSQTQHVVLSSYKEINDHKNNIKSLDLDSADVTVTKVYGDNAATFVNGSVQLKKNAADTTETPVGVGTLTNFSLAPNNTVRLPGSPAIDAFLLQQLQTAGSFDVIVNGTINNAPIHIDLAVTLHASLGYDSGLF